MGADERLDSLGIRDVVLGLPEHLEAALVADLDLGGLPAHDDVANVLLLGVGDAVATLEVASVVASPYAPVPIVLGDGHEPPSFVGPDTLAVAVSPSGRDDETIEATELALEAGARLIVVSGPGPLAGVGARAGAPVAPLDGPAAERPAIGASLVPVLRAFDRVGLFPGVNEWVGRAVDQTRRRRDALSRPGNLAEVLARHLQSTFPLVYGADRLGGVAAARWKAQVNQSAKTPAWAAEAPRLRHEDLCGFGLHGDVTRQVFSLVTLRHGQEHPQAEARFDKVVEILDEVVAGVHRVDAEGDGELAQLLDLVLVGDVVALELAARGGVDPGPTPIADDLAGI